MVKAGTDNSDARGGTFLEPVDIFHEPLFILADLMHSFSDSVFNFPLKLRQIL